MKKRKGFCIVLAGALLAGLGLSACGGTEEEPSPPEDTVKAVTYDLKPIDYEKPQTVRETNEEYLLTNLPSGSEVSAGDNVRFETKFNPNAVFPDFNYYLIDWGDGVWSYYGPCKQRLDKGEPYMPQFHRYRSAGEYEIAAAAVSMDRGTLRGWTAPQTVTVTGENDFKSEGLIETFELISSEAESKYTSAEYAVDNSNDTAFCSAPTTDATQQDYIGMLFEEHYTLSQLQVKIPAGLDYFSYNIGVEYTADGGKTWFVLPKYYYVESYNEGAYNPLMNFPNPGGATLEFALDGIVANGIRFVSKLYSPEQPRVEKQLQVAEIRVWGEKDKFFETSAGGEFDAALNNFWTTYGTAETQPRVSTSLINEDTETRPFNFGSKILGATEWDEIGAMKFLWMTGQDEVLDVLVNQCILARRYGYDDWSDVEGYIYATNDAPMHLNWQYHYVYNANFITCIRDYLLQGNYAGGYAGVDAVLQSTNGVGQTVLDRLEKAMNYQLEALNGKSGLLIILDPDNDGTANGTSSNLWDNIKCFGYKSAYENTFFYRSVLAMADIYDYLKQPAKAEEYRALAAEIKVNFNREFWDEEKGRYITSIDKNGVRHDFGITFVSYLALQAGLADEEQARRIYEWIDGERIIPGDTAQGEEIYGAFKIASITNTVDFATQPELWYNHNGILACTPGGGASYGKNIQNGGMCVYMNYYEFMGRNRYLGADNAFKKLSEVLDEFKIDQFKRFYDRLYDGVYGPDSGIMALIVTDGFMGIRLTGSGLEISPQLPSSLDRISVRSYRYHNKEYRIEVTRSAAEASAEERNGIIYLTVPAEGTVHVNFDGTIV